MDAGCPLMTPFFVLSSQSNTSLYINSATSKTQSFNTEKERGRKKLTDATLRVYLIFKVIFVKFTTQHHFVLQLFSITVWSGVT